MSTESWIDLTVAVVSLAMLFLASLVETSLSTVNRITLRELIEGQIGAHRAQSLLGRPQTLRSTMLLIELVAALLAAVTLTRLFDREIPRFAVLLAVVAGAAALLLTGRVLPVAIASGESADEPRRLTRLAAFLSLLVAPVAFVVDGLTRLLVGTMSHTGRAGGADADEEAPSERTENGAEEFDIEEDEQEMISGVLGLEEAMVREIMVPRLDIVAVPTDMPVTEVVDLIRRVGHSRVPVYDESIDSVIGIVYAKDLLRFVQDDCAGVVLADLIRPAYFVPESKRVDELLRDLRQEKVHIAIVVDEYGGTAGMVTIEDILEEIVGEIQDEYDREAPLVERVGAEEVIVDGRIGVDEVADIFETDFAEGQTGTVGGFVQKRLGRIPAAGESLRADGLLIEVQSVEHHRIRKLRVARLPEEQVVRVDHQAGAA